MPATIRLTRMGRKKRPFYRIVVVDSRVRRDGAYIEKLGYYNPFVEPYEVKLDHDKTIAWLGKGAGMSDTARGLLRNEGVLFRWHLEKAGTDLGEIESKVEEFRSRHGAKVEAVRSKQADAAATAKAKQDAAEKAKLKAKEAEAEVPAEVETVAKDGGEESTAAAEEGKEKAPEASGEETPAKAAKASEETPTEAAKASEETPTKETPADETPAEATKEETKPEGDAS